MNNKIENICLAFVFFLFIGLFLATAIAVDNRPTKEDKFTCVKYQQYAKEFPDFWVSAKDKVMCDDAGVELHTNVR